MAAAVADGRSLAREFMNMGDEEWQSWKSFGASASLLYRELDTALTVKHDLTVRDLHILHRLNTEPARYGRMGALAETLVCAPSRVTWHVRRLEERGLVRRAHSREDKRVIVVGITRRGQDYLRPALRTYSALVRQHYLAPLTRSQMAVLGDSASRISDALKR